MNATPEDRQHPSFPPLREGRCRRRSRRAPLHATVRLVAPFAALGTTINSSEGGLRVAMACRLAVGDLCTLRLTLETGHTDERQGSVVWVRPCRDGVVAGLRYLDVH